MKKPNLLPIVGQVDYAGAQLFIPPSLPSGLPFEFIGLGPCFADNLWVLKKYCSEKFSMEGSSFDQMAGEKFEDYVEDT